MTALLAEVTPTALGRVSRAPQADPGFDERPRAAGKFLFVGDRKLPVRGVTYGTFEQQTDGDDYPADALAALSLLGFSWPPLFSALPLPALAIAAPVAQAAIAASRARFPVPAPSMAQRWRRWGLVFGVHLAQPLARLLGRLRHGLSSAALAFTMARDHRQASGAVLALAPGLAQRADQ